MELNREQIIKALECCQTPWVSDCKVCGYEGKLLDDGTYLGCVNRLMVDAIALIKELTDKVGELECKCEELRADAISWQATVEEIAEGDKTLFDVIDALHRKNRAYDKVNLKAFDLEQANKELTEENKARKGLNTMLNNELRRLGEANERLQKALNTDISIVRVSRGNGKTAHLRELGRIKVDAIRADTVQKMAVRLAVHFGTYTDKDMVKIREVFRLIDQIAKEMEEEQNERQPT